MSEVRLIDAIALKKEFNKVYPLASNEMGCMVNKRIYEIIDNAPTKDWKFYYDHGFADAQKKFERPKGHWVLIHPLQEDDGGAYMCSECHTGDYYINVNCKFCPFCGADMSENSEENGNG